MRYQVFFLAVLIPMLSACSDDVKSQTKADTIGVKTDSPILQKKPSSPTKLPIGVAPTYTKPVVQIDYSKPTTSELDDTMPANLINQTKPSRTFGWEDSIHNKPLSEIKAVYDFNKSTSTESLVDLISYTHDELAVLDAAFPESININVKSVYDGDTILLNNSVLEENSAFKKDKNGNIKVRLMNIDCPELEQKGGTYAKERLVDFLSIPSHVTNNKKPKVKLRFRRASNQEDILAITTLDFGVQEFSLNRSMVYSGSCFTYTQYNQDRLLLSIESYAEYNKKNIWSQKPALIAKEQWIMPWDFRNKKAAQED